MAVIIDDRTEEQKNTHCCLVVGTDRFMTRLGHRLGAVGLKNRSLAAWACRPGDLRRVFEWVKNRSDMCRVRTTGVIRAGRYDHVHIYVVDEEHASLAKKEV